MISRVSEAVRVEEESAPRTGPRSTFKLAKMVATVLPSRSWMIGLGTTTGEATTAGATSLTAGSADTEARVPKARTTKEAISVKENVMGCVDLEV